MNAVRMRVLFSPRLCKSEHNGARYIIHPYPHAPAQALSGKIVNSVIAKRRSDGHTVLNLCFEYESSPGS